MSKSRKRRKPTPQSTTLASIPGQVPQTIPPGNAPLPGGIVVAQATSFTGPLPPPEILERYDEVLDGAAERIFKMAEAQAAHRQELEKRVVKSDIIKSYLGLVSALSIAIIAIVSGSFVAYSGQPWAGAAIGGSPVPILVLVFLKSTSHRREERDAKVQRLQPVQKS